MSKMYKFFSFVLLSALAAAGARRIDINGPLDRLIEKLNNNLRQTGTTSALFPEISVDSRVKYPNSRSLGVDSLRRTADCWQEVEGNDHHFDISYGYGLLAIVLPHLEIAGKNMSAYARIRDNSVHLAFTVHLADEKCQVRLNDMRIEKFGNVEFGASRPEFDGSNLEEYFKLVVKPKLNGIIDSYFEKMEESIQGLCKVPDFVTTGDVGKLVDGLM